MNSSDNVWLRDWRRFSVDVLMTAATLGVGAAALGSTADVVYLLVTLSALLGLALWLEPRATDFDLPPGGRFDNVSFERRNVP